MKSYVLASPCAGLSGNGMAGTTSGMPRITEAAGGETHVGGTPLRRASSHVTYGGMPRYSC